MNPLLFILGAYCVMFKQINNICVSSPAPTLPLKKKGGGEGVIGKKKGEELFGRLSEIMDR
jgi:hypothetical protein